MTAVKEYTFRFALISVSMVFFGLAPASRKSAWKKKNGFEKVKLERNADNSGRGFWAWIFFFWGGVPEILEKQGRKICGKNSPSNFAKKFAGNFPEIRWTQIKLHPKSALQSLGVKIMTIFLPCEVISKKSPQKMLREWPLRNEPLINRPQWHSALLPATAPFSRAPPCHWILPGSLALTGSTFGGSKKNTKLKILHFDLFWPTWVCYSPSLFYPRRFCT